VYFCNFVFLHTKPAALVIQMLMSDIYIQNIAFCVIILSISASRIVYQLMSWCGVHRPSGVYFLVSYSDHFPSVVH